jgi:hypothetical protein
MESHSRGTWDDGMEEARASMTARMTWFPKNEMTTLTENCDNAANDRRANLSEIPSPGHKINETNSVVAVLFVGFNVE